MRTPPAGDFNGSVAPVGRTDRAAEEGDGGAAGGTASACPRPQPAPEGEPPVRGAPQAAFRLAAENRRRFLDDLAGRLGMTSAQSARLADLAELRDREYRDAVQAVETTGAELSSAERLPYHQWANDRFYDRVRGLLDPQQEARLKEVMPK